MEESNKKRYREAAVARETGRHVTDLYQHLRRATEDYFYDIVSCLEARLFDRNCTIAALARSHAEAVAEYEDRIARLEAELAAMRGPAERGFLGAEGAPRDGDGLRSH